MTTYSDTAVEATGRDAGVAWHYGDPLREQRRLAEHAGVIDRGNRDVLAVDGPDRLGWLHTICSQHVRDLADGDATQALVLSPHGHVEQHWQLAELDGRVWIDTEPGAAPEVLGYLQKMRFLKRVEPLDVTADWAVLTVAGPHAAAVLASAGEPDPDGGARPGSLERAITRTDGGLVRRRGAEYDLIVPRPSATAVTAALVDAGAQPAGLWAYEALRVEAKLPRLGFETDHRTIPHEVGWIGSAVHLDKGCYRGQETVARVHNLGRPPRRLVLVHLAGESDELPPPGSPVEFGGRVVGFGGTAVHHHELGPVALAVIKRTLPADAELVIAGQRALGELDSGDV